MQRVRGQQGGVQRVWCWVHATPPWLLRQVAEVGEGRGHAKALVSTPLLLEAPLPS